MMATGIADLTICKSALRSLKKTAMPAITGGRKVERSSMIA